MLRVSQKDAAGYIAAGVPFVASALSGTVGAPGRAGRLEGEDLTLWRRHCVNPDVTFTVWSYGTPIAWRMADGSWVLVSGRFSVTTSKHQGVVRRAVGVSA